MSNPQPVSYANPKPPRRYSKLGIISVFLALLHLMLAAAGASIIWGAITALHTTKDPGPIPLIISFFLLGLAALALILLWLLGLILAVIGSFRATPRCWWSLSALLLHTILPIAILSAMLYHHWHP